MGWHMGEVRREGCPLEVGCGALGRSGSPSGPPPPGSSVMWGLQRSRKSFEEILM